MVFRRRDRRPVKTVVAEFFLPRGGWYRAAQYVVHRLSRLPDPPHRIARGIFAGVFISFTPLFGFHFLGAAGIAWALRGNILAALLATFFGNPLTTPLIALGSVELGHWIMGGQLGFGFEEILASFSAAWSAIYGNFLALFTARHASWEGLAEFIHNIFLPYLVGGIGPGIVTGLACYYASLPIVGAYQKLRDRKRRERIEKAMEKRQKAAEKVRLRAERAAARPPEEEA